MAEKLDRLVVAFESHGVAVGDNLRPGASEGQLDELAGLLGLELPEPFRALFRWRNGHLDPGARNVLRFRDTVFTRTDDIPEVRARVLQTYGPLFLDPGISLPEVDPSTCVPFAEFMGAVYAVVCGPAGEPGRDPHPVISFFQGVDLFFSSIESMADTCIEWVEQPDYRPDREAPNEMEIWRRRNPGVFGS